MRFGNATYLSVVSVNKKGTGDYAKRLLATKEAHPWFYKRVKTLADPAALRPHPTNRPPCPVALLAEAHDSSSRATQATRATTPKLSLLSALASDARVVWGSVYYVFEKQMTLWPSG